MITALWMFIVLWSAWNLVNAISHVANALASHVELERSKYQRVLEAKKKAEAYVAEMERWEHRESERQMGAVDRMYASKR